MWLDVILAKNHPKETHPQGISMRGEGKCQWFHCINCDRNKSIVYRVGFLNFGIITQNEYKTPYIWKFSHFKYLFMSSHLNKLSQLSAFKIRMLVPQISSLTGDWKDLFLIQGEGSLDNKHSNLKRTFFFQQREGTSN